MRLINMLCSRFLTGIIYAIEKTSCLRSCDEKFIGSWSGQRPKEKPALVAEITLLDIVANGTSIRLFRETAVSFDKNTFTRYVMNVRRQRGKGWMAFQRMWPEHQLELALMEVNRVAQQEIQRASVMAIA